MTSCVRGLTFPRAMCMAFLGEDSLSIVKEKQHKHTAVHMCSVEGYIPANSKSLVSTSSGRSLSRTCVCVRGLNTSW